MNLLDQPQIPKEWLCPLSLQIMKDPVIVSDGFTYERKQIQKWFAKSTISPITGLKLMNLNIIPNHALRHTIEQFLQKQPKGKRNHFFLGNKVKELKQKYEIPQLQLKVKYATDNDDLYIRCLIQPPEKPKIKRNACSIICILDISQSMDTDSVMGGRDVESHGFSRLDLVKHSMNTMIQFMEDNDQIALVPFNTSAKIAMPLTKTTKVGKRLIKQTVKNLKAMGTTNIWDGFKVSIQLLKQLNKRQYSHNIFVVLLTDGQPNLNPPRGIVPTLIKFLDLQKVPYPNIHVFGYGYELDTNLLAQISQVGHGTYTYIPDCSMVGTAFVNFMAGALSTITNNLSIKVDDLELEQVIGYKKLQKNMYNLGMLQYGQSREIVLKGRRSMPNSQSMKIAEISVYYGNEQQKKSISETIKWKLQVDNSDEMQKTILRSKYLLLLNALTKTKKTSISKSFKQVTQFYKYVQQQNKKKENSLTIALLKQLKNETSQNQGQVSKSFEKEQWWQKWGRHYIPSLYRAHLMQTCTNFKDPALQLYGGQLFQENRTKMDTIFIKMNPPQPSAKKVQKLIYVPPPVDMGCYYNQYGGCIHEDCLVSMQNGTRKPIKLLKKGDEVLGGVIECMVKTRVYQWVQMIKLGELIITPWHPIKINGNWVFPQEVPEGQKQQIFIQYFYNFVLKRSGVSLICQGIQCIGLGHQLNDNPVTAHEYFSQKILLDLERSRGWEKGEILLRKLLRDPVTKKVIGIQVGQ